MEDKSLILKNSSGSVLERLILVAENMIGDPVEDDLQKFIDWMKYEFEIKQETTG